MQYVDPLYEPWWARVPRGNSTWVYNEISDADWKTSTRTVFKNFQGIWNVEYRSSPTTDLPKTPQNDNLKTEELLEII